MIFVKFGINYQIMISHRLSDQLTLSLYDMDNLSINIRILDTPVRYSEYTIPEVDKIGKGLLNGTKFYRERRRR